MCIYFAELFIMGKHGNNQRDHQGETRLISYNAAMGGILCSHEKEQDRTQGRFSPMKLHDGPRLLQD